MRLLLELMPPTDLDGVLTALAQRDPFLGLWLAFMQRYPLVVMATMGDLALPHKLDTTREGHARWLDSNRVTVIAPVLGIRRGHRSGGRRRHADRSLPAA